MNITQLQRRQKRLERQYAPKINEALNKQVLSFIKDAKKYGISYARRQEINKEPLIRVLTDLYKTIILDSARITYNDLRSKVKDRGSMAVNEVWRNEVNAYLKKYLLDKAVDPISDYTRRLILDIVRAAIDGNLTLEETVQEIVNMGEINQMRAMRIVRTEVTSATNFGHMLGAYDSDFVYQKKWVEVKDGRTRASHRHGQNVDQRGRIVQGVGGEIVDLTQPFSNGLMYPGDTGPAKPEERINCRCVVTFQLKRDENGRAIRKPKPTTYMGGPRGTYRTSLLEALLSGFSATMLANTINELINSEQ